MISFQISSSFQFLYMFECFSVCNTEPSGAICFDSIQILLFSLPTESQREKQIAGDLPRHCFLSFNPPPNVSICDSASVGIFPQERHTLNTTANFVSFLVCDNMAEDFRSIMWKMVEHYKRATTAFNYLDSRTFKQSNQYVSHQCTATPAPEHQ